MGLIATICARGGSKGVPMKNLHPLLGKPLIVHTIEQARSCSEVDEVFVSTDHPEIAEVSRSAGAKVPGLRPAGLARDDTPKVPVIRHLLRAVEDSGTQVDRLVDLDPTSPLRWVSDIEACIALLTEDTDVVITGYESDKNPYFNMVEVGEEGFARLVKSPGDAVTRRQDAPRVYAMNASIYVWHRRTLSKGLWDGRARLYVMPRERSVDIDSPLDLEIVKLLMERSSNDG